MEDEAECAYRLVGISGKQTRAVHYDLGADKGGGKAGKHFLMVAFEPRLKGKIRL